MLVLVAGVERSFLHAKALFIILSSISFQEEILKRNSVIQPEAEPWGGWMLFIHRSRRDGG